MESRLLAVILYLLGQYFIAMVPMGNAAEDTEISTTTETSSSPHMPIRNIYETNQTDPPFPEDEPIDTTNDRDISKCLQYGDRALLDNIVGLGWDNLRNLPMAEVFRTTLYQCQMTPDGQYLLPDNVLALEVKQSSLDHIASFYASYQDHIRATSDSVNLEVSATFPSVPVTIGGSFSYDHQETKKTSMSTQSSILRTSLQYYAYDFVLDIANAYFSKALNDRLLEIGQAIENNQTKLALYLSQLVVRDYGTHVITRARVGAELSKEDYVDQSTMANHASSMTAIKAAASASFKDIVSVKIGAGHKADDKATSTYSSSLRHSKVKSKGALNVLKLMQNVKKLVDQETARKHTAVVDDRPTTNEDGNPDVNPDQPDGGSPDGSEGGSDGTDYGDTGGDPESYKKEIKYKNRVQFANRRKRQALLNGTVQSPNETAPLPIPDDYDGDDMADDYSTAKTPPRNLQRVNTDEVVAMDRSGEPLYHMINKYSLTAVSDDTADAIAYFIKKATLAYFEKNTLDGCMDPKAKGFDFKANKRDDSKCDREDHSYSLGGFFYYAKTDNKLDYNPDEYLLSGVTGGFYCPENYSPQLLSRSGIPKKKEYYVRLMYACHANNPLPRSGYMFGGFYTDDVPNPFTGTQSCPGHYIAMKLLHGITVCLSHNYDMDNIFSMDYGGVVTCQTAENSCPPGFTNYYAATYFVASISPEIDYKAFGPGCEFYFCLRASQIPEYQSMQIQMPPYITLMDEDVTTPKPTGTTPTTITSTTTASPN